MSEGINWDALFARYRNGDKEAGDAVFMAVYKELRQLARRSMGKHKRSQTIETTMLVNEACTRILGRGVIDVQTRAHLLNLASLAMRQILCDAARRRILRSQFLQPASEDDEIIVSDADQLVRVDQAINDLAKADEMAAKVIECKFFAGLSDEDTSAVTGLTPRSVQRSWQKGREWLRDYFEQK
jgi:RNA polymerase sigma factor (TIGR02999 family)